MYVSAVQITGFRSLGNVSANLRKYSCLIGKNDCGKSAFLHALVLLFDAESRPSVEDKCKIKGLDSVCSIEASLCSCGNRPPYTIDGEIKIKRILIGQGLGWHYLGQTPCLQSLKLMQAGDLTMKLYNDDNDLSSAVKAIVDNVLTQRESKGPVPKALWQTAYRELVNASLVKFEPGWTVLDAQELAGLVQVVMLKADMRGEEETADSGKSTFTRLAGLLLRQAMARHEGLTLAEQALKEQITTIGTKTEDDKWITPELNDFERILISEVQRFSPGITAEPILSLPRMPSLDFGVNVEISDQWVSGIEKMGHGLRRTVIYALLRTHQKMRLEMAKTCDETDEETQSPLHLFLMEEPELYLHPQAERQRHRELQDLAGLADTQVIVCTHSAMFVDIREYGGILRFSRPERKETVVHGWSGNIMLPRDKLTQSTIQFLNTNRAAMMFADHVILVEGASESVVIPELAYQLGISMEGVEVVDCGGKGSIPICQLILEGFGIPYVIWLDTDVSIHTPDLNAERTAKNLLDKVKGQMSSCYGKIVTTPGNWESFNSILRHKDTKPHASWRHFFIEDNEPSPALFARIEAAYAWESYEQDPVIEEPTT